MNRSLLPFILLASLSASAQEKKAKAPEFPQDVRMERNVDYLGGGRKEKADLYLPLEEPKKNLPAVVIIHGGGFIGGAKDAAREINIGSNLVRSGYIAMSIEYVLSEKGSVTWPQNLYDCKTAVRWLRKNASRLHIDADHIGVIGGSAGGHLAAMVALTGPEDGLDPKEPYGEFSCRVQCGVDLYGPAEFVARDVAMLGKKYAEDPELYRRASPATYASKGDPPLLIMHGSADKTVDVEQSRKMAAACEKAGIEHQLVIVEGAPHSFHMQPKQQDLRPIMIGFFDKHLKP